MAGSVGMGALLEASAQRAVGSPASSSTLVVVTGVKGIRAAMNILATACLTQAAPSACAYAYFWIPQKENEVLSHSSTSRPPVSEATLFGLFRETFATAESLSTKEVADNMLSGLRDACNDDATSMSWDV